MYHVCPRLALMTSHWNDDARDYGKYDANLPHVQQTWTTQAILPSDSLKSISMATYSCHRLVEIIKIISPYKLSKIKLHLDMSRHLLSRYYYQTVYVLKNSS